MKKHILLVDDDKDELLLFLDALNNLPDEDGFKCTYAASSTQAVEMLKYLVPDFIFVDYNMPQMNGLDLLSILAHERKLGKTKKFLYSVHIDEDSKSLATFLNVTCIRKANTLAELTQMLQSIIKPQPIQPVSSTNHW